MPSYPVYLRKLINVININVKIKAKIVNLFFWKSNLISNYKFKIKKKKYLQKLYV